MSRQLAETEEIAVPKLLHEDVAGRAAGNYRLAACAPQKPAAQLLYFSSARAMETHEQENACCPSRASKWAV